MWEPVISRKGKILIVSNLQKLFSLILKVEALHNREIIISLLNF